MPYRLLVAFLMIIQLVNSQGHKAYFAATDLLSASGEDDLHLYLPAVGNELPLKLVATTGVWTGDVPGSYYAGGYVLNTSAGPIYAVTLTATVVAVSIFDQTVYTRTWATSPFAFIATLPGQPNPFSIWFFQDRFMKSEFSAISLYTATTQSPLGLTYVALDASKWLTATERPGKWMITGTVRNDSNMAVSQARVVLAYNCLCDWFEAELFKLTLQPGESTIYHYDIYGPYEPIRVVPLAQGVVSP